MAPAGLPRSPAGLPRTIWGEPGDMDHGYVGPGCYGSEHIIVLDAMDVAARAFNATARAFHDMARAFHVSSFLQPSRPKQSKIRKVQTSDELIST